jgi:two-component system, OmpR family, alkaline phosphatase synthesis response regulator PhoP
LSRILIVDDEEDNLNVFTFMLEKEGFLVDSYTEPHAALSHFKPNLYDLLIVDYLMPTLNGVELCEKLTALDKSLKAIIVTATVDPTEIRECPAIKVIKKPILPSKLVGEIKKVLNSSQK